MNAIELTAPSLDKLSEVKQDNPAEPGPGRILVRMKAASLNFLDLSVAKGEYPGAVYPIVPLADGAGEVIAVGDEVWQVAVGDRVAVHFKAHWIAGQATAHTANAMRGVTLRGSLTEIAELDAASHAAYRRHDRLESPRRGFRRAGLHGGAARHGRRIDLRAPVCQGSRSQGHHHILVGQ